MSKQSTLKYRKQKLARLVAMQEPMERIIGKLPDDKALNVAAADEWVQISDCTHEQVADVMRSLGAGKWERKVSSGDNSKIDYETQIEGVRVLIYYAQPPSSCQIVTEEIEVPAHRKTVAKLICK